MEVSRSWLKTLAARKLTSDRFDHRMVRWVCFAMGPFLFYFGVVAVTRHATSEGEIAIGRLATISASLMPVVIGMLLPLASPAWRKHLTTHPD